KDSQGNADSQEEATFLIEHGAAAIDVRRYGVMLLQRATSDLFPCGGIGRALGNEQQDMAARRELEALAGRLPVVHLRQGEDAAESGRTGFPGDDPGVREDTHRFPRRVVRDGDGEIDAGPEL